MMQKYYRNQPMSSARQENAEILSGLSDKSGHYRPSPLPQRGGEGGVKGNAYMSKEKMRLY